MHPSYRHAQLFTWLWTLMPFSSLAVAGVLWLTADPQALWGLGIVLVTTVLILLVFGRLVVEVDATTLRWQFGWIGVPRWSLPLAQIERCESARGSASGAGIKGSRRNREYTAALSSAAVRFVLKDGRSILIGTPQPDRLRAFVEARLPGR